MRGAWVEIISQIYLTMWRLCRSPCGERGLKYDADVSVSHLVESLPVRGAWVEIAGSRPAFCVPNGSLPVRGAWVEIRKRTCDCQRGSASLPVRGAWVEMRKEVA